MVLDSGGCHKAVQDVQRRINVVRRAWQMKQTRETYHSCPYFLMQFGAKALPGRTVISLAVSENVGSPMTVGMVEKAFAAVPRGKRQDHIAKDLQIPADWRPVSVEEKLCLERDKVE
eukprot:1878114-Rhodomonas_salina.3